MPWFRSCLADKIKGAIMIDKLKALARSRRFWVAVGGVVVIAANATLGIDEDTANKLVAIAVAWIVGDSLRVTE